MNKLTFLITALLLVGSLWAQTNIVQADSTKQDPNLELITSAIAQMQKTLAPTSINIINQGVVLVDSELVKQINTGAQSSSISSHDGYTYTRAPGDVTLGFTRAVENSEKTLQVKATLTDYKMDSIKNIEYSLRDSGIVSVFEVVGSSQSANKPFVYLRDCILTETGEPCFRYIRIYEDKNTISYQLSDQGIWISSKQ